jgi:hypothetical protein
MYLVSVSRLSCFTATTKSFRRRLEVHSFMRVLYTHAQDSSSPLSKLVKNYSMYMVVSLSQARRRRNVSGYSKCSFSDNTDWFSPSLTPNTARSPISASRS